MAEVFEIEDKGNYQLVYCRKRKLELMVTERFDIPEHPKEMVIVFGTIKRGSHPQMKMPNDLIICFGIPEYDKIEYEPYFRHLLITNAITYYVNQEWHVNFDKVTYSKAYQENFIDTMSLEPEKMSPELRGYMSRDISEEPLDFFEWKEKHLKPLLN
jgi:hypothetical protein